MAFCTKILIKLILLIIIFLLNKNQKILSIKAIYNDVISDILASSLALILIISATRLIYLELIAELVISIFIFKNGFCLIKDAFIQVVDMSASNDKIEKIKKEVLSVNGVISIDLIKTRIFGTKIFVDLEITVDKDLSVFNGHKIAHNVSDLIILKNEEIKSCMVHINPSRK